MVISSIRVSLSRFCLAQAPLLRSPDAPPDLVGNCRAYTHTNARFLQILTGALLEQYFPERILKATIRSLSDTTAVHERVVNGNPAQLFALGDWTSREPTSNTTATSLFSGATMVQKQRVAP